MNNIKEFSKKFNKILTDKNNLKNEYFDYSKYSNDIWLIKTVSHFYSDKIELTDKLNNTILKQINILNKIYQLAFHYHKIKKINQSQRKELASLNKELCDDIILCGCMIRTQAEHQFISYEKFMNDAHTDRINNEWHYSNSLNNIQRKSILGKSNFNRFKDIVNITKFTRQIFVNRLVSTTDDIIYLDDMLLTSKLFLNRLSKNANTKQLLILDKYKLNIDELIQSLLYNQKEAIN